VRKEKKTIGEVIFFLFLLFSGEKRNFDINFNWQRDIKGQIPLFLIIVSSKVYNNL